MTIYPAGPKAGIPKWNFPAFDAAAERLRAAGYNVISPAETDRFVGFDENTTELPPGFRRKAIARDCRHLCKYADALAVLPGWADSSGARAEVASAVAMGLPIYDAATMESVTVGAIGRALYVDAWTVTSGAKGMKQ